MSKWTSRLNGARCVFPQLFLMSRCGDRMKSLERSLSEVGLETPVHHPQHECCPLNYSPNTPSLPFVPLYQVIRNDVLCSAFTVESRTICKSRRYGCICVCSCVGSEYLNGREMRTESILGWITVTTSVFLAVVPKQGPPTLSFHNSTPSFTLSLCQSHTDVTVGHIC